MSTEITEDACVEKVTAKLTATAAAAEKSVPVKKQTLLYDMNGILITTNQDICDCNEELCPGCFYPCEYCKSNKCGHVCRVNREWRYSVFEINDGAVEEKENVENQ